MTLIVKKTRNRKKTYKSKRLDFKIRSRGKSKHRKRVSIKRRKTRRNLRGGDLEASHRRSNKRNSEEYLGVSESQDRNFLTLKSKIETSIETLKDKMQNLKSSSSLTKESIREDKDLMNAYRFLLKVLSPFGFFSHEYYIEQNRGQEFLDITDLLDDIDNILDP